MSKTLQFIYPQPGFQERFLSSQADIVIGGGAAGAGKSYALLMEPLRHAGVKGFGAVCFRRTMPQIKSEGGLWDTCKGLYGRLGDAQSKITFSEQPPKCKFPSGASLSFSHLQYESDLVSWDGSQIPLLMFDELIHFTERQFWYMLSRNRTTCGVKPYVRATTNPQAFGWVKRLIGWWLYPDNHEHTHLRGMPIPERAAVLRYFFRMGEAMYWGNTVAEVMDSLPSDAREKAKPEIVKSLTFVPGTLAENRVLTDADPSYEGNLYAQDAANAERLLSGRWYMQAGADDLFAVPDVGDLFTNHFVQGTGEKYMTADIAMEGSDYFRVGIWDGLRLEKLYAWPKSDGKMIVQTLERLAKEHGVWGQRVAFDCNGVGNFLTGYFRTAFDFRSQARPLEVVGVKQNFENLRAQCLYKLAELVKDHKLYIQANGTERDDMTAELLPHKKTTRNGVNGATPKETIKAALGHSPDYADMLLMRMVWEVVPKRRTGYLGG